MKVTIQNIEGNPLPISSIRLRENEKASPVQLVRRWGGLATDALLDPQCQVFSIPHIEGFIGYRMTYGCAVVYGNPVCAPENAPELAQAFHRFGQERFKNIIYLTISEPFAKWAIQNLCKTLIEYGEEIYLDPHCNPKNRQGTYASLVRRKVRHAQRIGVSVQEYKPNDLKIEKAIEQVGVAWLRARRGPQVHISNVHLFDHRMGKRWFYAQQGDQIVGVVVLNRLESRQGWHLNHLMFTSQAANGTPELLITSVLETLANEECPFVSFGAVPAHDLGEMIGLTKFSTWMTRKAYKIASRFFHLPGHKMFWNKFFPETRPSYLLFEQPHIGWREIAALMQAMNFSI